jgi:hypothetical protein
MSQPATEPRYWGTRVLRGLSREVHIRIPKEDWEKIREYTRSRGYSLSWFFRTLAMQYIAKEERKQGK